MGLLVKSNTKDVVKALRSISITKRSGLSSVISSKVTAALVSNTNRVLSGAGQIRIFSILAAHASKGQLTNKAHNKNLIAAPYLGEPKHHHPCWFEPQR